MKLIPTSSQTVGPFFSIGLTPLYQDAQSAPSAEAITLMGKVLDGASQPILDAILEFWASAGFARVPTSDDGSFSVVLPPSAAERRSSFCDVLVFMRGLLKPVRTRVYLGDLESLKNNAELKAIPADRIETLLARKTDTPNRYAWDLFMQGNSETVFFHF